MLMKDGADLLLRPPYVGGDSPSDILTDLKIAMALGRVRFIEEIIRRSGWGIDFDLLESGWNADKRSSSVKLDAPRFYSGLRVRGAYRREWARASRPYQEAPYHSTKIPIMFLAAYYGNSDTLEWFFGDGPARAVDAFIKSHPKDKRVTLLENVDWKARLPDWFGISFTTDQDNALHAAIDGGSIDAVNTVIRLFMTNGIPMLEMLESKQRLPKHDTLLMSARTSMLFQPILRMYTAHGGDPTVTGEQGYNLFHIFARLQNDRNLAFSLEHLSKEQGEKMVTSRVAQLLCTPIAFAVQSARVDIVKMLLQYGKKQLRLRDGDGNLPIHTAVSRGLAKIAQLLLDADPTSIHVENTAGVLPVEIAQQHYLLSRTQTNPIANVYKTVMDSSTYVPWFEGRHVHAPFKRTSDSPSTETADPVATMDVLTKAMLGASVKQRELVPLLDVADVVRRATVVSNSNVWEYSNWYRTDGSKYVSESLWQSRGGWEVGC